jgi:hypothetical protein
MRRKRLSIFNKFIASSCLVIMMPSIAHAQHMKDSSPDKDLSLKALVQIAEAAVAACEAKGHSVSVTIVDRVGVKRVELVGDGAGPVPDPGLFSRSIRC